MVKIKGFFSRYFSIFSVYNSFTSLYKLLYLTIIWASYSLQVFIKMAIEIFNTWWSKINAMRA